MLSRADLLRIVEAGVRAPSADNDHRFRVRPIHDGFEVLSDEQAVAPVHRRLLGWVSLGAVVENMTIRAEQLGYQGQISWLPDGAGSSVIARARMARKPVRQSALDAAIETRHTNRALVFSGPPLSSDELGSLEKEAAAIEGVRLQWVRDGARRRLLRMMLLAEATRFDRQPLHEDLFSAVRFDVGWHATADTGLPPAALQVEPGARWAFSQLRHWPLMRVLRRFGVPRAIGMRAAYLPARMAPHLGFLTSSRPLDPDGAIAVGRAMERVWLQAERRGLAFQPFAAAGLLAQPDYLDVPSGVRDALRAGWSTLADGHPLMVFRMGRAKRPGITTARRAAASYLDAS